MLEPAPACLKSILQIHQSLALLKPPLTALPILPRLSQDHRAEHKCQKILHGALLSGLSRCVQWSSYRRN